MSGPNPLGSRLPYTGAPNAPVSNSIRSSMEPVVPAVLCGAASLTLGRRALDATEPA